VGYCLSGSKCKPNSCHEVYYFNEPKYFFCVNRGTTGNIFETCFGLSEQDWMDETSYNFAFQMSVSAFVF